MPRMVLFELTRVSVPRKLHTLILSAPGLSTLINPFQGLKQRGWMRRRGGKFLSTLINPFQGLKLELLRTSHRTPSFQLSLIPFRD